MRGDRTLALAPILPAFLEPATPPAGRPVAGAWVEYSSYRTGGESLTGATLSVDGLVRLSTDVFVRVRLRDGTEHSAVLRASQLTFTIPAHPSKGEVALSYWQMGTIHILEGLDHVLFVICLVLGAMHIKPLLWRVTGFTIGHSITLSLGFFGFVPAAAWFVPAVETGIALSIIYVAVVAVVPGLQQKKGEWAVVGVTGLIGLLHGLGFSFVLQNILQVTSPNIWQSLVAFNIGVELGQVLIVIGAWFVFYVIGLLGARTAKINRYLVASVCASIAFYWVIERGGNILVNL